MPTIELPLGVPTLKTQYPLADVLESAHTIVPTVATQTPPVLNKNTARKLLAGDFSVAIGWLGIEPTGGYGITRTTAFSAPVTVTQGDGIEISFPQADFTTNANNSIAAAVFLKKGASTKVYIANYAFVVSGGDFAYLLPFEQLNGALELQSADVIAATATQELGARTTVLAAGFRTRTPTSTGVEFNHAGTTVPVSLDTTVDFNLITARAVDIRTGIVRNDLRDLMEAIGGDRWGMVYTDATPADHNIEFGTAQDYIIGNAGVSNAAIIVNDIARTDGTFVTRLQLGQTVVNQADLREKSDKQSVKVLDVTFAHGAFDYLVQGVGTGVYYRADFASFT